VAGGESERPSQLVPVGIVVASASVRKSAVQRLHQLQETESQVVVEPGLLRRWHQRQKAHVRTSRGEQTSPSFFDLQGRAGCAERVQELLASLFRIPSEMADIALLSLAQVCKPFVPQTGSPAVLKVDDLEEEQQAVGDDGIETLLRDEIPELVVGHAIERTGFHRLQHSHYRFDVRVESLALKVVLGPLPPVQLVLESRENVKNHSWHLVMGVKQRGIATCLWHHGLSGLYQHSFRALLSSRRSLSKCH